MRFKTVQEYAKHNKLIPLKKVTLPSGTEIFIAEKYANTDPEFPEPHYQTWYHVAFGEERAMAGRKLFFRFGKQISKQKRIDEAIKDAKELIRHIEQPFEREYARNH